MFLSSSPSSAAPRKARKASRPASPDGPSRLTQIWSDAFDFVVSEGDADDLKRLTGLMLQARPGDTVLIDRVVEDQLRRKNRDNLIALFEQLSKLHQCREPSRTQTCDHLKKLWNGNLDSVLFFEESSGKLERARRLVEAKDCAPALVVLKEIDGKEGSTRPVLEELRDASICAQDAEAAQVQSDKLEKLRIFEGGNESKLR